MATALISACTKVPVRKDVAMTGEITLRGRVLPIGGLKEKALAAYRGGIRTVLIPQENEKDVKEIPLAVRKQLTIIPVEHMDQVLRQALVLEDADKFFRPMPVDGGPIEAPVPAGAAAEGKEQPAH
jgi:ATP-dependent Lon protease